MIGPIAGNNKSGRTGMLKCTECRRIRARVIQTRFLFFFIFFLFFIFFADGAQCVYSSEADPCEYCTERNLDCAKVWGPIKQSSNSSKGSSPEMSSALVTTPIPSDPPLSPYISFITDCDLPDRELLLLRRMHHRLCGSKFSSCVGTLLQNLWNSYGNIFENKTLLNAALMFESYWYESDKPTWSPNGSIEYIQFKSRFNMALWDAMESQHLTEADFLALFLASQSSKSGVMVFKKDLALYQQGMVRVLRFMNQSRKRGYRPLQNQESFFLSFTRRVMCRGDFSMPEYLVGDHSIESLPDHEVQEVSQRVRIAKGLPEMRSPVQPSPSPSPSPRYHYHPIELHTWDYWNSTVCCLCHEFEDMSVWFQLLVRQPPPGPESYLYLANEIKRTRQKVDGMLNIDNVSYVFKAVHPEIYESYNRCTTLLCP